MIQDQHCERESEILRAARSSYWDDNSRRHLDSCPSCREAVGILTALRSLAELPDESPVVPDPRLLWLKASFAARQQKSQLVSRIAGVAYGVLATFLGLGVYWFTRTDSTPLGTHVQSFFPSGDAWVPLLVLIFLLMALMFVFAPSRRHPAS